MQINNALKVEAQKDFSVNAQQLYSAWTNSEQLKQWWKPIGNALKEVENDIKPGGTVRYIFENDKLIISGEYLEAKENEKLVYTWKWEMPADAVRNADYKLTVTFANQDNGSRIHVVQENFEDEESMLPHQQGWEKGLSELDTYLKGASSSPNTESGTGGAGTESDGYREDPAQVKVGGG